MSNVRDLPADKMQDALDRIAKQPLKSGGGGHTIDPMEARVAKLEATAEFIQRELSDIKSDIREIKRDARTDSRLLFGESNDSAQFSNHSFIALAPLCHKAWLLNLTKKLG